ncbi:MAG TPA: phosphotyrosine protein phosphatase [Candidatus Nanoarchaeia archaeon]|nr:phosphotyrosine protein phosphatase [Candidatus Nanoarchaeia archaeon]
MKVLFVCNQNKHRSKTAEELFRRRFETRSAGLYNKKPLSDSKLSWADTVVVMEEEQRLEIAERFPTHYLKKRILVLGIPDIYSYNQPELIKLLEEKIKLSEN